jgi:hypothetical protein
MPGIVAPENFPIRDPRDPAQVVGRNVNPVRFMEMGGFETANRWWGSGGKRNDMAVHKPTNVRAAKDSTGMNADTK